MAKDAIAPNAVTDRRRVLIIDDERDFVLSLLDILESRGYEAAAAHSKAEGAAKARSFAPHVALLDVRLGMESGINIIPALKLACPDVQCIMMSAYADTETAIQALQRGAYDYLRKPLEVPDLLATVNRCLEKVGLVEERERADMELRRSEVRYRHIFESIKDVYIAVRVDGTVLEISPSIQDMAGHPPEALLGRSVHEIFAEDTRRRLLDRMNAHGSLDDFEIALKHRDGSLVPCSLSVKLVAGGHPDQAKIVGTMRDITERKRAEEEARKRQSHLIQADKMVTLGTLVAGVAHEINNPNNFISINASVLDDIWRGVLPALDQYVAENGDFPIGGSSYGALRNEIPQILKEVKNGSDRIRNIVTSLKDFARHETPGMDGTVDLAKVVDAAVKLTQSLVKKSTGHFTVDLPGDLPPVRGSFQRLEQVVINLISNACDALPATDRAVSLRGTYDSEQRAVLLTVEDQGEGIDPAEINHVFDPFYTTKRDTGGTGLGLSISDGIIRDHGGAIFIDSVPGKGTRVTVVLPAVEGATTGENCAKA